MTVISAVVGTTTPAAAVVVSKVTDGPVSVEVSTESTMASSTTYGPTNIDAEGVTRVSVFGLDADTKYFYRVLDNGVVDPTIGSFRTHPTLGEPADFTIAAASCAGASPVTPGEGAVLDSNRLSNHSVFTDIVNVNPLMFCHMGDLHYYDLGTEPSSVATGTLDNYRRAYDDVLLQPNQADLYRSVAWHYVWDDHDYGPNNSDGTLVTKENAQIAYRERVPYYALPGGTGEDTGAIYQSWQIGRVLFIASDVRSERSPNTDPDGPDKTILGEAQKAWMRGVLESSDAVFLVWITPSVWHHVTDAIDTWMQFPTEQAELIDMFTTTGWIDRMLAVWGDRHVLGIDDGSTTPGNIPGFQYAGLDSTPSGVVPSLFSTGPASAQRAQWGTLRFNDTVDTIEITGEGYVGSVIERSFTFEVIVTEPPEPGPPSEVGEAELRTDVRWYAFGLSTGRLITELPEVTGDISRAIGTYTSAAIVVPIPRAGPGKIPLASALQATSPIDVMFVAEVNNIPVWGGLLYERAGGTAATLDLPCATLESYFRHRFVTDHSFVDVDVSTIAQTLIEQDAGPIPGIGLGIGLIVDAEPTGTLVTRDYLATDHQSVYEAIRELADLENGIEWTIDLDWVTLDKEAISKIVRIRPRIGQAHVSPPAVFQSLPNSVFDTRGTSDATYTLTEDKTAGRFANVVVAYAAGQGEDQPVSSAHIDHAQLNAGRPIFEDHFQAGRELSVADLESHAARRLEEVRNGLTRWDLSTRWDAFPQYGVHWRLGDDIAWNLKGHRHPDGTVGRGRAIGWELKMERQVMIPILMQ